MNNKISKITSCALLCTMLTYTSPLVALAKSETVYSKQSSNGDIYNSIVSIQDDNGNYTQNETQKELPIECNIKYELDGKEISSKDIVGKSGKIKITLEYTNKDNHLVNVNGKNESLYTPFTVICGAIIDNKNNQNIEITNGKIIDNGSKSVAIGICIPGMQESLGISKDNLNIPSSVEITMDAKDFELGNIYSYVTTELLNDDLNLDKLDEIYSKINLLQDSSIQLENGANTLKEGIYTYTEKSQEFNNAMNQIAAGTNTINSSYSQIDTGINSLSSGSTNLKIGANELNAGINQLLSVLNSLPENVTLLYNGSSQILGALISDNQSGKIGLIDGVNSIIFSLETTTSSLVTTLSKVESESEQSINLLRANNQSLQAAIDALDPDTDGEIILTLQGQIGVNNNAITSYETAKYEATQTITYINKTSAESSQSIQALKEGMIALQSGATSLNNGLAELNTAAQSLPENLSKLSSGSKAVAEGSNQLSDGANTLKNGSSALKNGIQNLDTNTQKLNNANSQLLAGINTISDGSVTLADGITKFNTDGINPICNLVNKDLKNVSLRLEKLQELSRDYTNFSDLENKNDENVKFILVTNSIKKEED